MKTIPITKFLNAGTQLKEIPDEVIVYENGEAVAVDTEKVFRTQSIPTCCHLVFTFDKLEQHFDKEYQKWLFAKPETSDTLKAWFMLETEEEKEQNMSTISSEDWEYLDKVMDTNDFRDFLVTVITNESEWQDTQVSSES